MGPSDWTDGDGARRSRTSHIRNSLFPQWVGFHSWIQGRSLIGKSTSYQIATGAGDDTVRIWDIRSLKALYTIPAHVSNVSDVRFFRGDALPMRTVHGDGDVNMNDLDENAEKSNDKDEAPEEWRYRSGLYFATAGYDGFVKLWSADDWQLLRTLTTDAGKVMSVDLSSDGRLLASGTYNRNFQLFAPDDVPA